MARLEQAALALFLVSLVNGAFSFMSSLAFRVAGERIVRRIRRALFASLLLQEVAFFDRTMTGVRTAELAHLSKAARLTPIARQELVNRLSSDCTKLSDLMTIDIAMTMRWVATIVGCVLSLARGAKAARAPSVPDRTIPSQRHHLSLHRILAPVAGHGVRGAARGRGRQGVRRLCARPGP